ncbi:MAG: plasmid recombination protein, partial [Huintestinicola sp.]
GSSSHNLRLFTANTVDKTRTKDNIVFVNISQQEMYEKLFSGAVSEYNAIQKRIDRKITVSYYEHQFGKGYSPNVVTSADKRKSFYEDVVQIGDMKDTGVGTVDAETAKAVLTEYMNGFEHRNPNFKVFCAVLHMDEATPHLHIDYVPIGHYSRGIPVQNGIAQALSEMGFGVGKNAIARWRQSEYEVLKSICIRYDIELAPPKKSVGSKSVELYKEEKRLEEKVQKLREMELAADSTEVPYKKRIIGGGYILTEQEYAEFSAEKKAVSVQRVDAEIKVREAEECTRQTESRRLVLSEREDAFEKKKDTEEGEIWEKKQQTDVALWNAQRSERRAEELVREQQEINDVLSDTKAQLRRVTAENDRNKAYRYENDRLKKEIADTDKKHKEEVEKYSVKIKNLTEDVADRERIISEQQSGISKLEAQITEKDTIISKSKDTIKTWEGLYDNACAVGEYACRKLGRDFDRCLDMKIDNYRLSYIFGDERSR